MPPLPLIHRSALRPTPGSYQTANRENGNDRLAAIEATLESVNRPMLKQKVATLGVEALEAKTTT